MKNQNNLNHTKILFSVLFIISSLLTLNCNSNQPTILSVEAGLVYNAGDVKPVARTEFYLLDDNLETILNKAQLPPYMTTSSPTNPLENYAMSKLAFRGSNESGYDATNSVKAINEQADNAIKPHIISTMTTDFSGKGQFQNIKKGQYYVMGIGGNSKQIIIWNLPVEIKEGTQTLTLDNKNSAIIF